MEPFDFVPSKTEEKADLSGLRYLGKFEVLDDSLGPVYHAGDVVYFGRDATPADVSGIECVVETATGETLICYPILQPDGRYTLANDKGLMRANVRLLAADPVRWVQRKAARSLPAWCQISS